LPKLKKISGKTCIKILCKYFDFQSKGLSRRRNPCILRDFGAKISLKTGTLKGILELAKVKQEDFEKYI